MTKLTVYRALAPAILILLSVEFSRADETKPPIAPGFYHIQFRISDMVMSRIVEISNVRTDSVFKDGGYMDVTWIGMWPEPAPFIPVEKQNQSRTTGVFNPEAIKMVIPDIKTSRIIDVYYFKFEPTPDKHGAYKGTGDVPYAGPNGVGKNQFTCELEPLPNFSIPKGAQR